MLDTGNPVFDSIVQDEAAWSLESQESEVCRGAEPEGMDTFRNCSRDCKTVCSFKKRVGEVNCFACQQGGDDTCADIGQLDAPHPWCEPGGTCYEDPMLVCAAPFDAVGPRRSKLKCTNCKQRPDMCWQKVQDGTTTLTNCKLGCWNGTCEYRGKYTEKEWDGKDEFIHCYECVTPPPPPTCEELGWGYDWEMGCLKNCVAPDQCQEFLMTMGGPNDCCDKDAQKAADEGGEDGEDDDEGGTSVRGGGDGGGKGGGSKPKPGEGINDPNTPFGPNETGGTKTKPKDPCEEVAESLRDPGIVDEETPAEMQSRKRALERFKQSVTRLKDKAEKVDKHLSGSREQVAQLESQLRDAEAEYTKAKTEAKGAENLGSYGKQKLDALKSAETKLKQLRSHHSQAKAGLDRQTASFSKDINDLKSQALRDLYQADPQAKQAEEIGRTDRYYESWRDYNHLQESRKISDQVFAEKAAELQKKIDRGGSKAEDYQRQLDNLNRGKKDWDAVYDRRERMLIQDINEQQKTNGRDGVGPYDLQGLQQGVGQAAYLIDQQISKLKRIKSALEKAAKNNCPPKGAAEAAAEIGKKIDELEQAMKNMQDRYQEVVDGFPMSEEKKAGIRETAQKIAGGAIKTDEAKSFASLYLESQVEELARTFDPTDPSVGLKKLFWYSVGVVEGVGSAIKGLVELGVGALDLVAETAEGYFTKDRSWFGTDASETLQKVFGAADGNLNLDGLEKLAQGIDKALSSYLKKLSRSADLDKATARAGGHLAGELVVGDAVIARVAGKAGTLARGVDDVADGTRLRKGLDSGTGASQAPPKTPDIDIPTPKTPDTPPGTTTGKAAGKADDIPPSTVDTPSKPRAPPQVAKDFKGTRLPDQDVTPKPLADDVAKTLERENGFRADHAQNMHEFAQKKGVYLVVRDGNPDSVKFMKDADKMPKPMSSKAKTAKAGPESNKGLVVDPTHSQQAKYWEDDIAAAKAAGDETKVKYLEENRQKAVETWNSYGKEMTSNGYSVNKETGVIEYTDPVTGKHYSGVHGDYDLHGVFKPAEGGAPPKKVSFGSGQKFDSNGVDVEGGTLREQINGAIDPNKKYVQHGGQDDWVPDPKKVPDKGPDPPVTVFMPDGSTPVRLETAEDMKKFYQETMGVKWEYK